MSILQWSKSEVAYGRKLVDSAVQGARRGEIDFLQGKSLDHLLERSALHAMGPTILGACVGGFGSYLENKRSRKRTLVCALLGGAIGFGVSVIWENRDLTSSAASGAWHSMNKARDARWFEKNPIDYA